MRFRDYRPAIIFIVCLLAFLVFLGAIIVEDQKHDKRVYREHVATVERFCGPEKAAAFQATVGPFATSEDTAEWVKECIE